MNNNNILIITYFMVPYSPNWGNTQRMYFLADSLQSKGYNVTIICAYTGIHNTFGKDINFNIIPIRFSKYALLNNVENNSEAKTNSLLNKGKRIIKQLISKIYKGLTNEPVPHVAALGELFVLNAKEQVENIISNSNIDTVIISGPPFSIFKFASLIKKLNAKLILDYRDPWNLWNNKKGISYITEKYLLKKADKIISFSNEYKVDLSRSFNIKKSKVVNVFNGYSEKSWSKITDKPRVNKKMVISHVGAISFENDSYRNPNNFFDAIERFSKKDNIVLRFVGVDEDNNTKKLKKRFGNNIEFISRVTHERSLEYMMSSDVLLVIHNPDDNSSKYIISAKMFDYIRSTKYILSIGDENGLHSKIVNKLNIGKSTINNTQDIYHTINNIYTNWKKNELGVNKIDNLNFFSREYQNEKYVETLA